MMLRFENGAAAEFIQILSIIIHARVLFIFYYFCVLEGWKYGNTKAEAIGIVAELIFQPTYFRVFNAFLCVLVLCPLHLLI